MIPQNGRQRVIIENVTPEINGGYYMAKRVVGEKMTVEADVYADGHDQWAAVLLYRHESEKKYTPVRMKELTNDRWSASFIPEKQGVYFYSIEAWLDHGLSWHHDTSRKINGSQQVSVELLMGAEMLEGMIKSASKTEKVRLKEIVALFKDESQYEEACRVAQSHEVHDFFIQYPDNRHIVTYKVLKLYVDRPKALFSTWYELFPRSTSDVKDQHGTFKDVIKRLPRLEEMGMDVLYLPPVHPIGNAFRKGKNNNTQARPDEPGSPWAIGNIEGGHTALLPALGTMEDFVEMVIEAGKHGIEIAMDYALQCSQDHPWVKEHPQWFKWRPDGTIQYAENPPKKYQDVVPLNFECEDWQNLWLALKDILLFWVSKGIRIFRVDNPHTKSFRFWEWVIAEVKTVDPDVLFLSEAFTRPKIMQQLAKLGFSQSYTYFTWRNTKAELEAYMTELTQSEMRDYFRANFWPNTPDINPYNMQSGNENMFITRHCLASTLSSSYGFYGPVFEYLVHQAIPGKEEYLDSEKYEVKNWDWDKQTKLRQLITMINQIRKDNKALQTTYNYQSCKIENDMIMAYLRKTDDNQNCIMVVVNLDPFHRQSGWVKVPLSELGVAEGHHLVMHDLITDARYIWTKEWNFVELDPTMLPFHIFRIEGLKQH